MLTIIDHPLRPAVSPHSALQLRILFPQLDASGCSCDQHMATFGMHNATFRRASCNGQGRQRTTPCGLDQLHRGVLWQRLTCRPGMLGGSWKLGRRGTEFLFHVRAWLAKNVDVIDREDHGPCSYMYLSFWKCRPAFTC